MDSEIVEHRQDGFEISTDRPVAATKGCVRTFIGEQRLDQRAEQDPEYGCRSKAI